MFEDQGSWLKIIIIMYMSMARYIWIYMIMHLMDICMWTVCIYSIDACVPHTCALHTFPITCHWAQIKPFYLPQMKPCNWGAAWLCIYPGQWAVVGSFESMESKSYYHFCFNNSSKFVLSTLPLKCASWLVGSPQRTRLFAQIPLNSHQEWMISTQFIHFSQSECLILRIWEGN